MSRAHPAPAPVAGRGLPPPALALVLALLAIACGGLFAPKSEGEILWREHCAKCHGLDAAGNTVHYMSDAWADLSDDQWRYGGDESSIMSIVREGVFGKMPGNDKLSEEELRQVVAWLDHLRGGGGEGDESSEIE